MNPETRRKISPRSQSHRCVSGLRVDREHRGHGVDIMAGLGYLGHPPSREKAEDQDLWAADFGDLGYRTFLNSQCRRLP